MIGIKHICNLLLAASAVFVNAEGNKFYIWIILHLLLLLFFIEFINN